MVRLPKSNLKGVSTIGLLEMIFGRRKKQNITTRLEMINSGNAGFYSWDGNVYKSDIVRSCIRPKSKAVGKLTPKHIRNNQNEFKVNPDVNIRFLLEEPNPLMSGQVFQEKMATQLALNNNAFAYIKRDENGIASEIYPIPCTSVEVVQGSSGDIFLKFYFKTGKQITVPYTDIIHLRQDFNDDDFFGESPAEALTPLMEIVNTTDQGVVKAIKNSAVIKWILKFTSVLKPKDMQDRIDEFTKNYLSIENAGGAAGADPRYDVQQVKHDSYVPTSSQMDKTVQRIHSFFNTNEKIIQSKYSEDEWNAYYESEIEPLAMQLSAEYTRKLFTRRERGHGNEIVFEANNLQYASMKTKLGLVAMVDRGSMTPDEWRKILNLAPIEGGNKPIRRLDTAPVNQKGGEGENDENENGKKKPNKQD